MRQAENTMPRPHYHVTAGIILRQGKVLITKRPPGSHLEGYWEFPGGKQEPGENLKRCLEREITEELGITVKAGDLFMKVEHTYTAKRISLYVFCCTLLSGSPQALGCSEFKWVPVEALFQFAFPPPDVKVIGLLKKHPRAVKPNPQYAETPSLKGETGHVL